jgi:hypothetical protein
MLGGHKFTPSRFLSPMEYQLYTLLEGSRLVYHHSHFGEHKFKSRLNNGFLVVETQCSQNS